MSFTAWQPANSDVECAAKTHAYFQNTAMESQDNCIILASNFSNSEQVSNVVGNSGSYLAKLTGGSSGSVRVTKEGFV